MAENRQKPFERESFLCYISWYESAIDLTDDENVLGQVALAIWRYGFYKEEYKGDNPVVKSVLRSAWRQIEANARHRKNRGGSQNGVSNNPYGRRGKPKNTEETSDGTGAGSG